MASLPVSPSSFCRPEKDRFLLLESTFHAVQEILLRQRGRPLRRSRMDQLYEEEAITLLEEDVRPALKTCLVRILARIAELNDRILSKEFFIIHDSAVMGGKPCIRGLRIMVLTIIGLLASGESRERILQADPLLEAADIDHALAYAAWRLQTTDESLVAR